MIQTDYLDLVLDVKEFVPLVNRVCKFLKANQLIENHFLACKGLSGGIIAGAISYKLKMPIAVVRDKATDHSAWGLEGVFDLDHYVIIDDTFDSGETIRNIVDTVTTDRKDNYMLKKAKLSYILFYDDITPMEVKRLAKKYRCKVGTI